MCPHVLSGISTHEFIESLISSLFLAILCSCINRFLNSILEYWRDYLIIVNNTAEGHAQFKLFSSQTYDSNFWAQNLNHIVKVCVRYCNHVTVGLSPEVVEGHCFGSNEVFKNFKIFFG
jgi:hypothetical protein